MMKNVGGMDRVIRIILGLVILSLTLWGPKSPWALLGLAPLVTGLVGWCPPYTVLRINTCKRK